MSLKDLISTIMLLAQTSVARTSEIYLRDTKFLVKYSSGYILQFSKKTKTSEKHKPRNPKYHLFKENRNLTVCRHIDLYLNKKKEWHYKKSQVLLSFIRPGYKLLTPTVSRWLIKVLCLCGIGQRIVEF